jgi:uncharacterized membrane protein YedE/YeeE
MWSALAGGALIGLSASVLLAANGTVAGISSIVGGLVVPRSGSTAWRIAFLAGLISGAALLAWRLPIAIAPRPSALPLGWIGLAGLLVGFGTQLGGGCTSGHGVCGLSRFSARSLAAVLTFMATGALATFVVRHVVPVLR